MFTTGQKIAIEETKRSRLPETDLDNIKFGRVFSDHMFVMDYANGAWHKPRIETFVDLQMSPACLVLHYAQTIFEGMKAYRTGDGNVNLFPAPVEHRTDEPQCAPYVHAGDS